MESFDLNSLPNDVILLSDEKDDRVQSENTSFSASKQKKPYHSSSRVWEYFFNYNRHQKSCTMQYLPKSINILFDHNKSYLSY